LTKTTPTQPRRAATPWTPWTWMTASPECLTQCSHTKTMCAPETSTRLAKCSHTNTMWLLKLVV
jgi:hypothetical protein